jgi:hypothetical protein
VAESVVDVVVPEMDGGAVVLAEGELGQRAGCNERSRAGEQRTPGDARFSHD